MNCAKVKYVIHSQSSEPRDFDSQTNGRIIDTAIAIFKMVKSRRLRIYSKANFTWNVAEELRDNSKNSIIWKLFRLHVLTVGRMQNWCWEEHLIFRCSFVYCHYLGLVMNFLTRLEMLNISSGSNVPNFPPNLRKLTLSNFTMYQPTTSIVMCLETCL